MRQTRANTDKQMGVLSALRDLLRDGGVQARVIRHITLRMQGWPAAEDRGAELEVYGLGRQTAVVRIDTTPGQGIRFAITLPKSGTVVPLSDVKNPQSAVTWIRGWANGGTS